MAEAIAITSGKGGVGKSNICLNLGITLARKGYRVCLIDMDLGLKNLDVLMGLQNRIIYDLNDVMQSHCSLKQAMIKDKREDNLFLLPACKSIHVEKFKAEEVKKVVEHLKESFDYILLDSAAGLEKGFLSSIICVKKVIIATTLDYTALQDADRVIGLLYRENKEIQLVINKVNPRYIEKGISVSLQEALNFLSVDLLGVVYEDEALIRSANQACAPVYEIPSMMHDCFEVIANRLEGKRVDLPKFKGKSFMKRVFG